MMDLICRCVEIFQVVLCCGSGKEDGAETGWGQHYSYSQVINDYGSLSEGRVTSDPSTKLPFTTQPNENRLRRQCGFQAELEIEKKQKALAEFPASFSSTKLSSSSSSLSSAKPPPAFSQKLLSQVSQHPYSSLTSSSSSSSSSHKDKVVTQVSPNRPRDFLSSSSISHKQSEVSIKPRDFLSSSSVNTTSSSPSPVPKKPDFSTKPTLFKDSTNHNAKTKYHWVDGAASPTFSTPDDIKGLIEKDIVPRVLNNPLSISTYKDYFRALLYAEDCYLEKWDHFEMKNVTLELHYAATYKRSRLNSLDEDDKKDEKTFVAFEIDKVPEKRPFLLSRDFVSLRRPSKKNFLLFEGLVYRVVKSNLLLAEFGEDFHSQHCPDYKYEVKFSFNRVCLKRAHQAIESASGPLFRNFLFPEFLPENRLLSKHFFAYNTLDSEQSSALDKILRLQASPPYLVKGPISVTENLIVAAVVELCRASPLNRVLLCAPSNKTCDLIMRALKKQVPEHDMFRANAAFRERDGVPLDILPSCLYEDKTECFSCPLLNELCRYKVILSTFMSSYRLHNVGIKAGHFSHIFLVDASSATEPETLVPLANFATEGTVTLVTGEPRNHSGWVRSPMARKFGLARSYFERLCGSKLYMSLDPNAITVLRDEYQSC
ncbi:PREDICTED: probable RNA helicase SDE3 [Ipomoea nil]|uniref:probable RNA helicase SDE3 n=1 Tax=Ipomoea nil TaxID=35883 RepID=UPI00090110FE|nr:PREDICTED: probable RNA helicase SDE3 [Ipomoea nil]